MRISADMSLALLGQESNLAGHLPCVAVMRRLLVENFDGGDTLDLWRNHQKKWLALWDEAIANAAQAPASEKAPHQRRNSDSTQFELLF